MIISSLENIERSEDKTISIKIPDYISYPLGIKNNSRIRLYRFSDSNDDEHGVELRIVPDGLASHEGKSILHVSIKMGDAPGTFAEMSKIFRELDINILWSQQHSLQLKKTSSWFLIIEKG